MLRSGTILAGVVLAFAVACGSEKEEKEKAAAGKACAAAPAAMSAEPKLPAGFPTPSEVTYTGEKAAGPSTIVEGYWNGEIDDAFDGYKSAFDDAGYDVTKDEHEEVDAEVNFSGGSSTGQVKLVQECKDRTTVSITVRPS
ncbi:MAG TPA: hypothetical protein VF101_03440 [Gaiellaceae bacterium]